MPKLNYEAVLKYIDKTMVPYFEKNVPLMLLGGEIAGKSHVCEKHVALGKEELKKRLSDRNIASSFTDYNSAEMYVRKILFNFQAWG